MTARSDRRVVGSLTVALVVALVAGACSGEPPPRVTDEPPRDPIGAAPEETLAPGRETEHRADLREAGADDEIAFVADHLADVGLTFTHAFDQHLALPGDPYAEAAHVLAELDHLARQHVAAMALATLGIVRDRNERARTALDTVGGNTAALTEVIERHFSDEAARRFRELWEAHVTRLVEHAEAVADGEATGNIRADLDPLIEEITTYFVDLTAGAVPRGELASALRAHVDTFVSLIEAQPRGAPEWLPRWPPAMDAMARVARPIAAGIAEAEDLDGDVDSEAALLRADFAGRLAENPSFLARATRAKLDEDAGSFEVARDLVRRNTDEIADIYATHLGEAAAQRFVEIWSRGNTLIIELTHPIDEPGVSRDEIRDQLEEWAEAFAVFMVDVTGGAAERSTVHTHVEEFWQRSSDYIEAQEAARER